MPKKKASTKSENKARKLLVPILLAISVSFNIIFLGSIIAMKTGVLDYAIVNNGIDVMCSESFRDKTAASGPEHSIAVLDYGCGRDDKASQYYSEGFDKYLESQGLSRQEQ